jgi:phage terminase large subunit
MFLDEIPIEFRGGWDIKKHAPEMRLMFPETASTITGEGGDNIGRGDRTSIYFVDESAHLMRPQLIEASLSSTTNCRQDISTPNGMANPFAQKRFSGRIDVFTYDWHADPRKDETWYEKQKNDLDGISLAQEIDINYAASVDGLVIEPDWIASAIDFAENLNIEPTGSIVGAFDVADGGNDLNAFGVRKGIQPTFLKSWSGKGSDIFASTDKVFLMADENNCAEWFYDADGLGAGVNGDAKVINDRRKATGLRVHNVKMFRGSGEIVDPEKEMIKGRKNKDFFQNHKAQAWWSLRFRFQETHRVKLAYTENKLAECKFNKDDLISLPSNIVGFELPKLRIELTQPRYTLSTLGKIVIDKNPDGAKSPNLADCLMMLFAPVKVKPAGMFS